MLINKFENNFKNTIAAMATSCTRQLLPDVNRPDLTYFMENLMNKICDFYDQQDLVDVTFKLSNPTAFVPAHRLILSAASPYLKELLNDVNGTVPVIEIDCIKSDTFERLVTFCYTGQTLVTIANVEEMLKGATILKLDDVIISCIEYLMEHICEFTLERAYSLERETDCALLKKKILAYEIQNFNEVIQSTDFLKIGAEKFKALIESENLNVSCEDDVYRAVKRWYEYDIPARQQKLPELIECLRLTQFDFDYLITNIQPLPGCEVLALRAVSWIAAPSNREKITLRFTKSREGLSEKLEPILLAVSMKEDISILQYDKDEWQGYADTKLDAEWYSVVLLDDNLIFIGGIRDNRISNVVMSWNLKNESWKTLPSMNVQRSSLCAVVLNGKIYAIGGGTAGGEYTNTVEMYSDGNGWKFVCSTGTPRPNAGTVAFNAKIFVIGGYNCGHLKSVECYDPSTDIWTQCADMNEARELPGVAVHNGLIYAVGGYTGCQTVERFDPQRNRWTMVCSLNVGRGGIGCAVIDNQLWAIGGLETVNSVSVYKPECDEWEEKESIPKSAMATSCTRQLLPDVNRPDLTYFMEKLMNKICDFYDQQDLVDVTFKLSNPTAFVPAHRLILSAASPYLKELLNDVNGTVPVIEIDCIKSDTFERLVAFCYTGQTLVTIANVEEMLKGALILKLDDVIISCIDYLMEHISEFTLEWAYSLERETDCTLLKEKILAYEIQNFNEVSQDVEFLNFGAEKLQALIESENLNVSCEDDVYRAVKRWYEYDVPARQQKLPELIECLRLTQFDLDYLLANIQSLPGCELLAFKAVSWITAPSQREKITLRFTKSRAGLRETLEDPILLAVTMGKDISISQYDKTKYEWQGYTDIKRDEDWYSVVLLDDNLIFIGGVCNKIRSNVVTSWNLRTESWKPLPSMNVPRSCLCAVVLNGKIYAISGSTAVGKNTNTVEMYSDGNQWKLVRSMQTLCQHAVAVVLNHKIFVMGGYNCGNLKSVECYDPSTDIWTQCADMNEARQLPGVAVHNGLIYAIGGYSASKTVERYDPYRNTWTMVCSLNVGRGGIGCVIMDNQLWAIGGGATVNSVSVYNAECDKWEEKEPAPKYGKFSCFIVPKRVLKTN